MGKHGVRPLLGWEMACMVCVCVTPSQRVTAESSTRRSAPFLLIAAISAPRPIARRDDYGSAGGDLLWPSQRQLVVPGRPDESKGPEGRENAEGYRKVTGIAKNWSGESQRGYEATMREQRRSANCRTALIWKLKWHAESEVCNLCEFGSLNCKLIRKCRLNRNLLYSA
jgi:hypothetical protein